MTRGVARQLVSLGVSGLVMAFGSDAAAQAAAGEGTFIDESVADRDPLSTSLRFVDPAQAGNLNDARSVLLDPGDPARGVSPLYEFRAPGFRATYPRPEYQTGPGGGTFVAAPAGTVYGLTLPVITPGELSPEALRLRVDTRLDSRRWNQGPLIDLDPTAAPPPVSPWWLQPQTPASGASAKPAIQPWVAQPADLDALTDAQLEAMPYRIVRPGDATVITEPPALETDSEAEPREQADAVGTE